jgi:hypothetical protein
MYGKLKKLLFFSEIFEKFKASSDFEFCGRFFYTTRNLLGHPFVEQRFIPVARAGHR